MPNIPVIIDDIKRLDGFEMTRCVYFHIECEDTLDLWRLTSDGIEIPFLMLGLSGIIIRPMSGRSEFESAQDIEQLFSFIEGLRQEGRDEAHMNVEIADVWLPNRTLELQRQAIPGDVYRVDSVLFESAVAFTTGRLQYGSFLERAISGQREVLFSGQETKVIQEWARRTISRSRDSRHPDLQLPTRNRG
jgi:hypothetical protein